MSTIAFNLLAASALILLVLLLREPVARIFGARAAYALWLAPALRLVMIPLPSQEPLPAETAEAALEWIAVTEQSIGTSASWAVSNDLIIMIWTIGAIVTLGWALFSHRAFLTRVMCDARPIGRRSSLEILSSPGVDGPIATGLFRRLIIVPDDFEDHFTPEQQRFALMHEEMHHRRGDIWAMTIAVVVRSALWFNPLAYPAFRSFRRDMEAACDASLMRHSGSGEAQAYGATIVRSASRPAAGMLCALTSIEDLKRRLRMLKWSHGRIRNAMGLGAASILIGGGLLFAMPAQADEKQQEHVEKKIVWNSSDGEQNIEIDGKDLAEMCDGELMNFQAQAGDGDKKEISRVALCMKGESDAEKAANLEKALEKFGKDSHVNASARAEIERQMREKIAELRG